MNSFYDLGFFNGAVLTGRLPGVTGQSMPPAVLYPGLKRPRLDYARVYYGLGHFIFPGNIMA